MTEGEQALIKLIEEGVSASADKLAAVSMTTWSTQTLSVKQVPLQDLQSPAGAGEGEHYGCYFTMTGGVFLVLFPKTSGPSLAQAFLAKRPDAKNPTPLQVRDAVAEVANIVVHGIANRMADACDGVFFLSAPQSATGSKEALIKAAPQKISTTPDSFTLMAYVHMASEQLSSDCAIVLLLGAAWRERLLQALEK